MRFFDGNSQSRFSSVFKVQESLVDNELIYESWFGLDTRSLMIKIQLCQTNKQVLHSRNLIADQHNSLLVDWPSQYLQYVSKTSAVPRKLELLLFQLKCDVNSFCWSSIYVRIKVALKYSCIISGSFFFFWFQERCVQFAYSRESIESSSSSRSVNF